MLAQKVPSLIPTEKQPNAPPKSQKNFIPSFIWNWDAQNATCFFRKNRKNFFEKTVYLKNISSLVPIGRGLLGTVFLYF